MISCMKCGRGYDTATTYFQHRLGTDDCRNKVAVHPRIRYAEGTNDGEDGSA